MTQPDVDRRRFLQLAGGTAALSMLPASIERAAAIPARREHGSIKDVEHIVVLIQENRSFDHYFGTLRGVRGYGDPHPARQPDGHSVFHQRDHDGTVTLPFRPNVDDLGLAFIRDLDHSWAGSHQAFNAGRYDDWIAAKTTTTMAHLERRDMPFHYALADAFTICDAYHCSLLGPTDPNRYYAWTGWVGNDRKGGGPVIGNDELGYSWTTYPERLEAAGVSWKIYQDTGTGLDAAGTWGYTADAYIGNYGDNALLYFNQYRTALPGSPLYEKARTGTHAQGGDGLFDQLRADVAGGTLPQVSWIVAPEAFTEHPNWPANYGAWYVSQVLDALTSDPDVWSRTALLITYDENDGFFDHLVPPYAHGPGLPGSSTVPTTHELFRSGSGTTPGHSDGETADYGLGVRVPMLVVSPWSTGGFVCSETFDHTSMLRFIERRFGVHEPNIAPWRRAVCGDLTSAFDFSRHAARTPSLPSTAGYEPKDDQRHPDYTPEVPAKGRLPHQEPGTRPSRPLGYRLGVTEKRSAANALTLALHNNGRLGAAFQVRSGSRTWSHTAGAGDTATAEVPVHGDYDVDVHGPDGFFRRFAGQGAAPLDVTLVEHRHGAAQLRIRNTGSTRRSIEVHDAYSGTRQHRQVPAHGHLEIDVDTERRGGWYDLTVSGEHLRRTLAGRMQGGRSTTSDPQLGARH